MPEGVAAYGSATLVDENGQGVLLVVAVTTSISVIVWIALWWRCSHGGRLSGCVALACVTILAAFCLLGMLSVELFVAPVAVLLACAAPSTLSGSR